MGGGRGRAGQSVRGKPSLLAEDAGTRKWVWGVGGACEIG